MSNDPYVIPGSYVLKNKMNITDQGELDLAEDTVIKFTLFTARKLKGEFDYKHLMALHKHIFGDIYDWAGNPRIINIDKPEHVLGGMSVEYGDHSRVAAKTKETIAKLTSVNWNQLISVEQKAEAFSQCLAELWKAHPFREGNTRTIMEFCIQYAASQNIFLDRNLFGQNAKFTRNALVMASIGEYSEFIHINKIVKDAIENGENLQSRGKPSMADVIKAAKVKSNESNSTKKLRNQNRRSKDLNR